MSKRAVIGWDLGGAHLKAALVVDGQLRAVRQLPCPLWRGLNHLDKAVTDILATWDEVRQHALTMTGELVDLFPDRKTGVEALIARMQEHLLGTLHIYAGRHGLLPPAQAQSHSAHIASANWLASASFAAARRDAGLILDIGSTTTDLVPFTHQQILTDSISDADRLARDELVYSGVVRTPVCAVVMRAPFAGQWQGLCAELFATMADVYRLLGVLPDGADQGDTADGRGKDIDSSARRLARMFGRDYHAEALPHWRQAAAFIARRHLRRIEDAAVRVLSTSTLRTDAPVLGAGVGRFRAMHLAKTLGRPYLDFGTLCSPDPALAAAAADCAPAAALALLKDTSDVGG